MDRALDPELLRLALGETPPQSLPTVEALLDLLTQAELALLLHRTEQSDALAAIGWYLHGIASSKFALRIYGVERQRAAFKVAGHIFDLLSKTTDVSEYVRLKYVFAAQIAYLRSELDPNAIAVYSRRFVANLSQLNFTDEFQQLSLAVGVAFLGFDTRYVFDTARNVRDIVGRLEKEWGVETIFGTPFGAAYGVISGAGNFLHFLVYGNQGSLSQAKQIFRRAVNEDASLQDHISRWVAAHLLNLADGLENSSIWSSLPPEVPPFVRKAFTLGSPKVLTLWPPQLELFRSERNPLSADSKRLFLSTPTSGGKTLLAQLLIVSHLEILGTAVCYIAPTRSLCREVKRTLENRLKYINAEVVDNALEWEESHSENNAQPAVEVMTPERLSHLLRTDSEETLRRFGFFVFDEVHLVGEKGRGWTLEESLTYINYATQHTAHKVVLISAVVGNRNHFVQWISAEDTNPIYSHSDWRGPRRIHAIYTTDPKWEEETVLPIRSSIYTHRTSYPQFGKLDVRISHTGTTHSLSTAEQVGVLVFKRKSLFDRPGEKDTAQSTSFYRMLVPIVQYLADAGSVLIIESTRPGTVRLAKAIAEQQEAIEPREIQHVLDLVEARLTAHHPLFSLLKKGVAYHHGSLPNEIRVAIEELVSDGYVKILVATTTLTEGVNLPVRSVVIASQGTATAQGYVEYITGSRLINAIGRAGRAAKETEGIVVLAWNKEPNPDVFDRLTPDDRELQVVSMLARTEALSELAAFEEQQNRFEDAIFEVEPGTLSEFLQFVWFIAAQFDQLRQPLNLETINSVLERSLGWIQLSQEDRHRWSSVANIIVNRYNQIDGQERRRWAKSGTSLNSARKLENISQEIAEAIVNTQIPVGGLETIELIIADGRLQQILDLPEFTHRRVFRQRGTRQEISIPLTAILGDWILGQTLVELAETYLAAVDDIEYRFEQLGDFISYYFEMQLPWIFSTVVTWVNELLLNNGSAQMLSTDIPSYIRWGVDKPVAVELLNRGVLSRRLALRIASEWRSIETSADVYTWIRSMQLSDWQERFDCSTADLRSLLDYSRNRGGGVTAELIRQEVAKIEVVTRYAEYPSTEVEIRAADGSWLAPLAIFHGDELVGSIRGRDQRDIQDIYNIGIAILTMFSASDGIGTLELQILDIGS